MVAEACEARKHDRLDFRCVFASNKEEGILIGRLFGTDPKACVNKKDANTAHIEYAGCELRRIVFIFGARRIEAPKPHLRVGV